MLDLFEQYERRRNLSRRTIVDRHRRLASLQAWVGGDLYDADHEAITAWLDGAQRPLTPPSRYTYISEVNAFYQWAVREGYLLTNPCDRVDKPRLPLRSPRPLSLEAVERMIAEPPTAHPAVVLWSALGAFAGLRNAEMAALQVPELDFGKGRVFVAGGKGDKDREVAMHHIVREQLRRLGVPRAGFVTPKREGVGAYRPETVGGYIARHMQICGVEGTPHQLRHFFITEVAEHGDLLVAKEAAGHASISTTAGYAAHNGRRLESAVLAVGERGSRERCPACGHY
jgi:site-specific recombinase XerD